jgi:hypothetical protein
MMVITTSISIRVTPAWADRLFLRICCFMITPPRR